jgi:hypothetical protein
MPFHFEFEHEHRILLVVAEGEFDDADQLGVIDAIAAHAAGLNVAAGIGDYSQLEAFTASGAAVRMAARMPSPYPPGIPRFLVAPRDHVFGASRMYKTIGKQSRSTLLVVRSRAEALESLGVRNPSFERMGGR